MGGSELRDSLAVKGGWGLTVNGSEWMDTGTWGTRDLVSHWGGKSGPAYTPTYS